MKEYKNWVIPSKNKEVGEIIRVSNLFNISVEIIKSLLNESSISNLSSSEWSVLYNTESWHISDISEAYKVSEGHGRNLSALLDSFRNEKEMESPIILFLPNGKSHLVSGNTRLIACRVLNIRPGVLKLRAT